MFFSLVYIWHQIGLYSYTYMRGGIAVQHDSRGSAIIMLMRCVYTSKAHFTRVCICIYCTYYSIYLKYIDFLFGSLVTSMCIDYYV